MTAKKPAARRYALLLALWDSDYARKAYGGYHNVFVAALGGVGDGAERGEFPAAEDLASYDGFVVSGSPRDAHGDEPWVRRLCALLRTLHAMRKRVLGVCFGHQVLCRALGGRVGRARSGWDVGVRKVTFVHGQDLAGLLPLLNVGDDLPRSASIIEVVHQDEVRVDILYCAVWEIPPTATVLAYSEKTRVEAFAVGGARAGHPGPPGVHRRHPPQPHRPSYRPERHPEERRRGGAADGGGDRRAGPRVLDHALQGLPQGRGSRTIHDCGGSWPTTATAAAPEVAGRAVAVATSCFTGTAPTVQLAYRAISVLRA
ncbi:unnamed protein product [Miscanthus lutarioriparius]|uniref:Glutamine amidotransferase domain-containing protein n=1 Tax=Miscanthus lutarioriparius TaxID=422564 RepID=A0A811Q3B1_9POAL|nr:unnamed protein product [Miscanthus lutarioriparius]